jgi:hypothetical protein
VSLPDRDALSLVFVVAAPGAQVRVDSAEVKANFVVVNSGSNTGTSGEPPPTRTTLDAHARGSNVVQRGEPRVYRESAVIIASGESLW